MINTGINVVNQLWLQLSCQLFACVIQWLYQPKGKLKKKKEKRNKVRAMFVFMLLGITFYLESSTFAGSAGVGFTPHVISVKTGEVSLSHLNFHFHFS